MLISIHSGLILDMELIQTKNFKEKTSIWEILGLIWTEDYMLGSKLSNARLKLKYVLKGV